MTYATKTFYGASHGARTEYVKVEQIEKDIANNRSKLKVTFKVYGNDPGATLYLHYKTDIDVDGQNVFDYPETQWYGSGSPDNPKSTFPAATGEVSKEIWVNHDNLGNKTLTVYFYTGIFSSSTKGNYGGSMTLESIPRASSYGTISGNNIGSNITININRNSSSFTHKVWYKIGNTGWVVVAENAGTSCTFQLPMSLCEQVTSDTKGTLYLSIRTLNGSTAIGSDVDTSITVYVPDSVKPSASISISEADATMISKGWGIYVKDKSKLATTITGTKAYNSNITTYNSSIQSISYNKSSYTSNVLTQSGSHNVTATVKDARGRTSSQATKAFTVIDYFKPKITTSNIDRCDVNGNLTDEGTYLLFSFAGNIAPVSNKNSKTFKIGYRVRGSTSSFTFVTIGTAYDLSSNKVILTNSGGTKITFDNTTSYEIVFQAIDSFETVQTFKDIGTGFDLINLNPSGNALAIGKISEANPDQRLFEIGIDTEYKGQPLLEYEVVSQW